MKKKLLLGFVGIFFLCSLVSLISSLTGGNKTNKAATPTAIAKAEAKQASEAKPTMAPKPTNTVALPTATPTSDEFIAQIAQTAFGKNLIEAKLSEIDSTDVYATVDYDLGTQWDEGTAIRSAAQDLKKIGAQVFSISKVTALELRAFTEFKDAYGKTTNDVAIKFTVARETANKIDWKNIDARSFGVVLTDDGDGVYVHPSLRKAWTDYVAHR